MAEVELRGRPASRSTAAPGSPRSQRRASVWRSEALPSIPSRGATSPRWSRRSCPAAPLRGARRHHRRAGRRGDGEEDHQHKARPARRDLDPRHDAASSSPIRPPRSRPASCRRSMWRRPAERDLVLTTGGKSEQYAMALHPHLSEPAFIQVGDFIGVGVRHSVASGMPARRGGDDGEALEDGQGPDADARRGLRGGPAVPGLARGRLGAAGELVAAIEGANTARHVLELCREAGLSASPRWSARRWSSTARGIRTARSTYTPVWSISAEDCSAVIRRQFHERHAGGILSTMMSGLETGFILDRQWFRLQGEMERTKRPALLALARVLADTETSYAIIGGVALQTHQAEPRTTLDIQVAGIR